MCVAAVFPQELASAGLLATPDSPNPARFEWQTLGKLSYLQACIREGLRLFSPAANGSWRMSAHTDIQISHNLTLPKVRISLDASLTLWCVVLCGRKHMGCPLAWQKGPRLFAFVAHCSWRICTLADQPDCCRSSVTSKCAQVGVE